MAEAKPLKTKLPAGVLSPKLFEELFTILGRDGEVVWEAVVGTGGDLLGKQQDRSHRVVTDQSELVGLLAALPRIDGLQLTAEVTGRGAVSITFRTYGRPGGALAVTSEDRSWAANMLTALSALFAAAKDNEASRYYGKYTFGLLQTGIPFALAFVTTLLATAIVIPGEIRRSEWVWWIAVLSVLLTFRIAQLISDRIVLRLMRRYPYIRWLS